MSNRLKKVDEGHYLVPDCDLEVVCDGAPTHSNWNVYLGNAKQLGPFDTYELARAQALRLRELAAEQAAAQGDNQHG